MTTRLALAAAMLIAAPRWAGACNACVEDKVAATYDWRVIAEAQRAHHVVVFTALIGPAAGASRLEPEVRRALASVGGIDRGSLRISFTPPAVSFACDPAREAPDRLVARASQRLAPMKLSLATVRVGAPGRVVVLETSR